MLCSSGKFCFSDWLISISIDLSAWLLWVWVKWPISVNRSRWFLHHAKLSPQWACVPGDPSHSRSRLQRRAYQKLAHPASWLHSDVSPCQSFIDWAEKLFVSFLNKTIRLNRFMYHSKWEKYASHSKYIYFRCCYPDLFLLWQILPFRGCFPQIDSVVQ